MGRIYLEHFGGQRLFSCGRCETFLTNREELISTRFTGSTGRAFLFKRVVNLSHSEPSERVNEITNDYQFFKNSCIFLLKNSLRSC